MKSQAESTHIDLLWGMDPGGAFAWAMGTTNHAISTMAERFPGEHMIVHLGGCRVLLDGCTCHPVIIQPSPKRAA